MGIQLIAEPTVTIFHVLLERSLKSHTSAQGLCEETHAGSIHPTPPTAARGLCPDRHTDTGLPGAQSGAGSLSRLPTGVYMRRGIANAEQPALSKSLPQPPRFSHGEVQNDTSSVARKFVIPALSICCSSLILVWKLQIFC